MILTLLKDHQSAALLYLMAHDPCALFMFLGSGKSLIALAYAEHLKARRILITSDKNNVVHTWPDQVWRHTDMNVLVRPTWEELNNLAHSFNAHPCCVCVNYDYLRSSQNLHYIRQVKWDLWIGDESSEFKDQRTRRHKALKSAVGSIPHRVMLNGVPMTERLEDLWGQFSILCGERNPLGRTFTVFRRRYMQMDPRGYGFVPRRSAFSNVQTALKPVSYWLQDDGSIEMPEQNYIRVEVEMTEDQKRIDDELKAEFASSLKRSHIETNYAADLFGKRVQLTGGIFRPSTEEERVEFLWSRKLDILRKIIFDNTGSKIVVWHKYVPETLWISAYLVSLQVSFAVYDQDHPDGLSRFSQSDGPKVLLIRTSMCRGLNQLVGADIAVFYSNPFSYARRAQAEGRTRRLTSGFETTHYIDIVTRDGADAVVESQLSMKKSMSLTLTSLRKLV